MSKHTIINIASIGVLTTILVFMRIPFITLIIAFGIVLFLVMKVLKSDYPKFFSSNQSLWSLIGVSMVYAIGIEVLMCFVLAPIIVDFTGVPINYGRFELVVGQPGILFHSLLIGWLIGGLVEETIFRGYFLECIERIVPKNMGRVIGILFSSLLFGYLHAYQGISGQILTGIFGAILALIYLMNRNLWLNMFTHGFVNTISLLLIYYQMIQ